MKSNFGPAKLVLSLLSFIGKASECTEIWSPQIDTSIVFLDSCWPVEDLHMPARLSHSFSIRDCHTSQQPSRALEGLDVQQIFGK
jgi:hypothetical protein